SWAVGLMATVAEAVHFAHQKGVIHRDLKPANILIQQSKRPVVMDFGIARVGKGAGLTIQGTLIGTPAYMPPEQAADEPDKSGPTPAVSSLGPILYTLLTGKAPFHEGSAMRPILKVVSSDSPPSIRELRPEVSPRLERVCFKAL